MQTDLFENVPAILSGPIISGFTEVEKDEFYKVIGPQNVHPFPTGDFPYTSEFKTPQHVVKGIVTETFTNGKYPIVKRYYLKS